MEKPAMLSSLFRHWLIFFLASLRLAQYKTGSDSA
jgi:hypothetical protein